MPPKKIKSVEGKTLISVKFRRQNPNPVGPVIEAIFEIVEPEGIVESTAYVLKLLSVTRTDTREAVTVTREERESAKMQVADYAETLMKQD